MTGRAARAAWWLAAGLALAAPLGAAPAAAEPGEGARIGRYRVTRAGDALEIALPADRRIGFQVGGAGAVVVVLGLGVLSAGRRGFGAGLVAVGLGLMLLAAFGVLGTARVRASRAELVRETALGRERWPREALRGVEVRRRPPSADDFKRVGGPRWEVRVAGREGAALPVRFTLASEGEAQTLAAALATALGLPPPDR